MATKRWAALMLAPLAVSLAIGYGSAAVAAPKNEEAKAAAKAAKQEQKALKSVKVKAPPRPKVQTRVAPGTWHFPRHKGNSPKFRPDREKDWVDPTGGKKPVRVKE